MRKIVLLFAMLSLLLSCIESHDASNQQSTGSNRYNYKKTKLLIETVRRGAEIVQSQGIDALREFEKYQKNQDIYFYIYRLSDFLCIYHGEDSTRINTLVKNEFDIIGRPIKDLVREALRDTIDNPDAWVHFNWPTPNDIFPTWKSSCHRKIKMLDGTEAFIGAGMYGYISEQEFLRISVNKACRIIALKGDSSLAIIQSPKSPYFFFDCSIFIYDFFGNSIIDPSYRKNSKLNLLVFEDATNHHPFKAIADQLKIKEDSWNALQFNSHESMNIRKKIIYCRNARFNGRDVIVGSMMDAPISVWFK